HHDALLVLAAPHGAEALAALRQPARPLHEVDLKEWGPRHGPAYQAKGATPPSWSPPAQTFGAPRRSRGAPRHRGSPHPSAAAEPTTCEAWWSTIFQPSASRWKMFVAMTDVTDTRPRTWERMFSVQVTQARLPETASCTSPTVKRISPVLWKMASQDARTFSHP